MQLPNEYEAGRDTAADALYAKLADVKNMRSRCETYSDRYRELTNEIYRISGEIHRLLRDRNRSAKPL